MDVYGLVGNPVGHSLSPPMHEAAYDELGIDARYVTFEPDAIGAAISGAQDLGIEGLNVTIPFKEDALSHVEPDPLADRIGAVNTIDFSGSAPPAGYNTDAEGARRAFERHDVSLAGTSAVVVGAGGAARAIAFMLADDGARVRIANRTVSRAESLAAVVPEASAHGLEALDDIVPDADILVNATSVGMEDDASPVPAETLHGDLAVMDAVYSPLETRLIREAADRGATTIDGAWMLLFQGVVAFETWTGRTAPVERMDAALRRRL
ncbi:shikimate dehydrogenase [Haladaptatus caseinilyticus]|uniref:shikimate dehydrogenase n=1 Tax=Haladaptatus caseinilyticus TaxID=2993314 RepID=UPI00224B299F|nr:shikimate dehydrogenase [Haladaptatus caseinilyticus]